ncbi:integrase [Syntrophus buswellii]|uniref:integrase n=1 Tax=Syntrophus buswellii TaxID=43774 RepID=UPI0038D4942E
MAIFAECPVCRKKQSAKNRICSCGVDLVKAKGSNRVKYWRDYYYISSDGKRKRVRESIGYSIKAAQAAEGKKKVEKKENRFFDIKPESKMTFSELTTWYLKLESVKVLASYSILQVYLRKFNSEYGHMIVSKIKPADLENLREKRRKEGCADATIDHEIGSAKTMVFKAFDNDIVSGDTIRTFKKMKKLVKRNGNARNKILTHDEFKNLLANASPHIQQIMMTAYYTGMRRGEILGLTWNKVDLKNRFICLEASDTKDREARKIPICNELYAVFKKIPRAIHDDHVFLFKGKPVKDIRTALKNACDKANIPYGRFQKEGFIFHDYRHTANTNMRKAGVSESVIMAITGHSTREMFDRYNTIDDQDIHQAMKQVETFFGNSD